MPVRHELFIIHYLECLNATEAARRAGYKDGPWLRHFAQKLTTKSHIRGGIRVGMDAMMMSAEEVLSRISDIARGCIADFLEIDGEGHSRIDLAKARKLHKLGLIKRLSFDRQGRPEIELYSGLDALAHLAKAHSLFDRKGVGTEQASPPEVRRLAMRDPETVALLVKVADRISALEAGAVRTETPVTKLIT